MRTTQNKTVWGAMAGALIVASFASAQQNISDGELLDVLDAVNQQQAASNSAAEVDEIMVAPVVDEVLVSSNAAAEPADPVVQLLDTIESNEARVETVDEVMDDLAVAEVAEEESIDNLGMVSYDDDEASSEGNLISVRLNNVGLEEAINLFAQLSGANIIVPELTEAAQISVNLKDVEWRPALQSILDTYNYELYQRVSGSNVHSVRRRPAGAPEPQVVETFVLHYATVPDAVELIKGLLPPDAKISEFASRNMIVVKSSESSLSEVRAVLETIDIVRQQVYIESKFMELSDDAQKDLGIDWQVLKNYSVGTSGSTEETYRRTTADNQVNTALLDASGKPYAEGSGFSNPGSLNPTTPVYEGLTPTVKRLSEDGTTKVLTSVLSADEFRVALSALEANKGVNMVSNPKIIVANEELANISIVRMEPNLKQERQQSLNDQPDTITFTLDPDEPFFKFGIQLDVTPSINTSSNITVKIKPSLTRKFGDKQAGENTYPIIDEKTIETIFNLSSGQTAAIGGLTEVTDGEEERKVPVLGSIPYLGRLFSWKRTTHGQTETLIFVTVGLANTQEIDIETGLPVDSELGRRQIIKDRNKKTLRNQGRVYYQNQEDDKLDDALSVMKAKEDARKDRRIEALEKALDKANKAQAKEAAKRDVASIN